MIVPRNPIHIPTDIITIETVKYSFVYRFFDGPLHVASGQQQPLVFEFGFSKIVRQKSLPDVSKTGGTPVVAHYSPW